MNKMNIALIGSTGLIGSEIYSHLRNSHSITTFGRNPQNDKHLDVSSVKSIESLELKNYDVIIHAAGVTDEQFKENPEKAFHQGTYCTSTLMNQAIKSNVEKIIYFSTAHVYGTFKSQILESTPPNPLSAYSTSHYSTEQLMKGITMGTETSCLVVRPNAVFGIPPNLKSFNRWGLIPYSFPLEGITKNKITLKSAGVQKRNFISTSDLAKYVKFYLDESKTFGNFHIINPIGPESISIREFAQKCCDFISKITGTKCEVNIEAKHNKDIYDDNFEYQTIYKKFKCKDTTDNYLTKIIPMIKALNNE
ncbi:MAG: SDR family oxidoreductase [SAR202 cluster bacterium]|nr:SDR family oxidoreductase [SAR202 cluster bacterium]